MKIGQWYDLERPRDCPADGRARLRPSRVGLDRQGAAPRTDKKRLRRCRRRRARRASATRGEGEQKKPKRIEKWSREGSIAAAKKKSRAYGALFFLGTAGFVHSIFAAPVLVTLGVAGAVAAVGARAIFKAYEPAPEQPKKK